MAADSVWPRIRLWAWGLREVARRGRPHHLLHLVGGVGDELLCSCILHEWRKRDIRNVWLMTARPELFQNSPDRPEVVPHDRRYVGLARRLGARECEPRYTARAGEDRDVSPPRHVLRIMLAAAGIRGRVALRPYLHLTSAERTAEEWARECIVVHTSGQGAAFHNRLKEYPMERWQAVADRLRDHGRVIQIGHRDDPLLENVHDLRGRTSLRQTAAVLANARMFVGLEGGLMHIARSVDCPAVIIFGGRLWPEQTGYIAYENLASRPPCAPCWGWTRCDFEHRCMGAIAAADVLAAAERVLARPVGPLPVENADIDDVDEWMPPKQIE